MTKIIVDDPEWFDEDERYTELPSVCGTTRETFMGEEWVYKRPLNTRHQERNEVEALQYAAQVKGDPSPRDYFNGVPIAECYLMSDGTLKMRRVKRIRNLRGDADVEGVSNDQLPEWAWKVDGDQVGYDHRGQIVAYDL